MIILLHSSKTMRPPATHTGPSLSRPLLLARSIEIHDYLKTLSPSRLESVMNVSKPLALQTHTLIANWNTDANKQREAIDSFLGDIYSGLQVSNWNQADRVYANKTLRILSGLYGILRPLDGIYPYRLEMGYKLPKKQYANLYTFWGSAIANTLPATGMIIDLSAKEYNKTITPFVDYKRIITPTFLTTNPSTGKPTFVTVHAKIARGAFAAWLIKNRVDNLNSMKAFDVIGYRYDKALSTAHAPIFVCKQFAGKGLSVRLK